jgi:hypothetical protein
MKVKIMKRAFLIIISALAVVGLLIADVAWPKASIADEIPVPAASAEAASTPKAASSSVPMEAVPKTSESASQGIKAGEASDQSNQSKPGLAEAASEHDEEAAAATAAPAAEPSADQQKSSEETAEKTAEENPVH